MGMTKTHWLLCRGDDFAAACALVQNFFRTSLLLHYDAVEPEADGSWPAVAEGFWPALEQGIAENRQVLMGLLNDLKVEGVVEIAALADLPMGYPSKVLHTIAHLVDGFIGIDSVFYNLAEDSHWLSPGLRATIRQQPQRYWLIRVKASFRSAASASLIHHQQPEP